VADVRVLGAKVSAGRIESVRVSFHGLPERTVGRDEVVRWMKDGHSLTPVVAGRRTTALQLVEVGDAWFVRSDNAPDTSDSLPELPSV
jgi:hypothetical protein